MAWYVDGETVEHTQYIQALRWRGYLVTPQQEEYWGNWTVNHSSGTSTATAATITYNRIDVDTAWQIWNGSSTGSWNQTQYSRGVEAHQYERMRPPDLTPEQRAERQHFLEARREREANRERLYQEREQQRVEDRTQSKTRALELLKIVLTEEEWNIYESSRQIIITGSNGSRFRVGDGDYQGNVYLLGTDTNGNDLRAASFCAHPRMRVEGGELPLLDAVVTQVLALKTNEEAFIRIANMYPSAQDWRSYLGGNAIAEQQAA